MRILIVKLGALGDVVLALPVARALRRAFPSAHIAWLVESRNAAVLAGSADLDRVVELPSDRGRGMLRGGSLGQLYRLARELRSERFELVVELQGLVKSGIWAWVTGARSRIGLPRAWLREPVSRAFVAAAADEPKLRHVVDAYLWVASSAIAAVGGPEPGASTGAFEGLLRLTDDERAWAAREIERHRLGPRFVVLNPGASWVTKRWPVDRFVALAKRLVANAGVSVFVAYGPAEEGMARAIVEGAGAGVCGFPSDVRQLAALLEQAELFVGGDTGPYHLARAIGCKTVGLFGATDPARNGPHDDENGESTRHHVVWGQVPCSPCNARRCPTSIECMAGIDVDEVESRALELLR